MPYRAPNQARTAPCPASAPLGGAYYLTLADATALGLLSGSTILDGYVGFSDAVSWAYNDSDGVPAGDYDLYGVIAHEISEVMGRISMLTTPGEYSDLISSDFRLRVYALLLALRRGIFRSITETPL